MARKLSPAQVTTLSRINAGWPQSELQSGLLPAEPLTILARHDCMDGAVVRCHRTVKTDTPAGSQVQGFRIDTFGTATRFI